MSKAIDRSMRPCPFCGHFGATIRESNKCTKKLYRANCDGCGASGAWAYNSEAAKKEWNRRSGK